MLRCIRNLVGSRWGPRPIRERRTSESLEASGMRRSFHRTNTKNDHRRNELVSFRLSETMTFRKGGSSQSISEVPFTLTCLVLIGRQSRCLILSTRSGGMYDVIEELEEVGIHFAQVTPICCGQRIWPVARCLGMGRASSWRLAAGIRVE